MLSPTLSYAVDTDSETDSFPGHRIEVEFEFDGITATIAHNGLVHCIELATPQKIELTTTQKKLAVSSESHSVLQYDYRNQT